jgi:hypothetical protein
VAVQAPLPHSITAPAHALPPPQATSHGAFAGHATMSPGQAPPPPHATVQPDDCAQTTSVFRHALPPPQSTVHVMPGGHVTMAPLHSGPHWMVHCSPASPEQPPLQAAGHCAGGEVVPVGQGPPSQAGSPPSWSHTGTITSRPASAGPPSAAVLPSPPDPSTIAAASLVEASFTGPGVPPLDPHPAAATARRTRAIFISPLYAADRRAARHVPHHPTEARIVREMGSDENVENSRARARTSSPRRPSQAARRSSANARALGYR